MKTSTLVKLVVCLALMVAFAAPASAQGLFATLTGIVSDPSGAVVPGATVKLINEASGSTRVTTTDASGYYTFASVIVGDFTYKLTVESKGFSTYVAPGLTILGGEKRNINVTLQVGSTTQTVEVSGVVSSIVPVDSGEKSQTLTSRQIQDFVQVGTDAAEFIKIMPGFSIQNNTNNVANYTGEVIGINANGDAGSQSPLNNAYSYNGLPSNSLDIMADGAHVSDPGCNCDTPVNPNSNMVSEMKVNMSNFNAENQKGPIVVSSVTKSGGSHFHGSGFFSARNFALNANDALNNANGAPKPENKYYYPGFTFGGPVLIPGTGFNKKREKLFFFTGYQYFYQVLDTGLLRATLPNPAMLNGDFSTASLEKIGDANNNYVTASGAPAGVACLDSGGNPITPYTPCLNSAALALYPGGIIPPSQLSSSMLNLMKLYPAVNANPNQTGGYNYVQSQIFNQNNVQWATRVDYNISDNTKMFVRYNLQRETQQFPVGLWWRNGSQVPYPTPVLGKNRSDSVSVSLTHVFSPTLTNEFVFGYTFIGFPNVFEDPAKVDRTKLGVDITGLFKNNVAQIPSFGQFGGEAALVFNVGGFEAGGPSAGLYANKYMPSISDTVAKVIAKHTLKAGFYWEWIRNAQPANNYTNGLLTFQASGNTNTTGDAYADQVLGILNSYQETNFNRINDIAYNSYEWFLQDDWKVTKRLTLNLGLRFSHIQPWADRLGFGYPIFNPANYSSSCAAAPTYCGFEWYKKDPSIPLGGFPTRALFYQPRVGVAYDIFGKGKTVLRGGWGRYYFHAGQFTNGLDASAGVESVTVGYNAPLPGGGTQPLLVDPLQQFPGAAGLNSLPFSAVAAAPAAVDSMDDKEPYTDSYNATISQRMPWSSMLQIAYVGNRTRDIPSTGNGGTLGINTYNINLVPVGAMLASNNGGVDPNSLVADQFRPFLGYSNLYVTTSNGYSNYNALQVTWNRTKGRYGLALNYTYGKAMGILGVASGPLFNEFNLDDNYGVLASNRTHIFNAAYSIQLGDHTKRKLAGAFINGWQVSGITEIESGANLPAFRSENFGMNLNSAKIPGTDFNISNVSVLGTPNIQLNPVVTCNPSEGLGSHQYINPNCFSVPMQIGQNGPTVMHPIYGPAFVASDLGLFKTFKITESQNLQFRVEGYNFLNHPLWSFPGQQNLNLSFDPTTGKVNNPLFGTTTTKQGHRVIELSVRYEF
ncbi:MAG: carboxypeptidase regulatory-like domain-containing protein [Acidobacteriota bacterium]